MGRREAPASATVSQHPAPSPLAEVRGYGAASGGGGGQAAEKSGGGTALVLIYPTVGGDGFQSISALPISSVHRPLPSWVFSPSNFLDCTNFPIGVRELSLINNMCSGHLAG